MRQSQTHLSPIGRLVDNLLEASVIGSFSRVGYLARRRIGHWAPLGEQKGRHVVVTGATSGIGFEVARVMSRLGASVTIIARNEERSKKAVEQISQESPDSAIDFVLADMSEFASVMEASKVLLSRNRPIDALIHNAGALSHTFTLTKEGSEATLSTHLLAPHLLTQLLLPLLEQASPSRVIMVSSGGMYTQKFTLKTLEMSALHYDGVVAYARAKRAQLVLGHEWARRYETKRIVFHVMHPGWVDTPGISSALPVFHRLMGPLLRKVNQGADTIEWLAANPVALTSSGKFWLDRQERLEYKLSRTRSLSPLEDQKILWDWCNKKIEGYLKN